MSSIAKLRDQGRGYHFELVPFDKIRPSTARNYLIKDLIPREGLIVVWGPPKCGKSFWMYDTAMHIALGWVYRGRHVMKGTVVYVACEGAPGLAARTEAFRRRKLAEDHEPVPFYLVTTRLDLVGEFETLIFDIKAQLADVNPVLVIIDTLNRSIRGSESSDEDMGNYVKAADAVRAAFGCTVAVVHHCGIDSQRPRGHTSLSGAADAQIAVKRDAADLIVTTVEFMKDGAEGATTCSKLEVVEVAIDDDGEAVTSCVVVAADDGERGRNRVKVTGQAKIGLDLLRKAIADAGEILPAGGHFPGGQERGVPFDLWRRYCRKGGLTEGDNDDTFKKAWQRVRERLLSRGIIGVWDGRVWIAASEGDKET